MNKVTKSLAAATVGAMVVSLAPASASTSEQASYTHPDCKGSNAVCGVVVMGNAGVYTLNWVALNAHSSQPSPATHTSCKGFDKKLGDDVPSGNYDTFIVPASCSYKLKTDIKSGPSKDLNIFLTPGCQIIAKVDGTTSSNSWKTLEISVLDTAKGKVTTDKNGKPLDPAGYKCGKLSGADTYIED